MTGRGAAVCWSRDDMRRRLVVVVLGLTLGVFRVCSSCINKSALRSWLLVVVDLVAAGRGEEKGSCWRSETVS